MLRDALPELDELEAITR